MRGIQTIKNTSQSQLPTEEDKSWLVLKRPLYCGHYQGSVYYLHELCSHVPSNLLSLDICPISSSLVNNTLGLKKCLSIFYRFPVLSPVYGVLICQVCAGFGQEETSRDGVVTLKVMVTQDIWAAIQ